MSKRLIVDYFIKHSKELSWGAGTYFIAFSCWSVYLVVKILVESVDYFWYTIPLLIYIFSAFIGGCMLVRNSKHAINYLIIAQIPQVIYLHSNSFVYSMLIGQWFVVGFKNITNVIMYTGVFDVKYQLILLSENNSDNVFGINLIPIILISILLKIEEYS